jgi:hypothetical protein
MTAPHSAREAFASLRWHHWKRALAGVALVCAGACAEETLTVAPDQRDHHIVSQSGQEILITLGNVGPALYEAPPHISSTAVTYLGVDVVPPFTPAGPTQQFRFRAEHRGEAIVIFRRLLGDSVVSTVRDTIEVR